MHHVRAHGFKQVPEVIARAEQAEDFVRIQAEGSQVPETYADETGYQHAHRGYFQPAPARLSGRAAWRGGGGYRGHAASGTGAGRFNRRSRRFTRVGRFRVARPYISAINSKLAAAHSPMVKRFLANQNQ